MDKDINRLKVVLAEKKRTIYLNNSIKPVIDGTITSIKDIILKLKIDINQL